VGLLDAPRRSEESGLPSCPFVGFSQPCERIVQVGVTAQCECKATRLLNLRRGDARILFESRVHTRRWLVEFECEGVRDLQATCARQEGEDHPASIKSGEPKKTTSYSHPAKPRSRCSEPPTMPLPAPKWLEVWDVWGSRIRWVDSLSLHAKNALSSEYPPSRALFPLSNRP
jgi:hypothetical protein